MVLPTVDEVMEAFDEMDEEGTEFVPRLDLRKHLDTIAESKYPLVAELAAEVRALDAMILEREDFQEMVEEWLPGAQSRDVEVSVKVKAPSVEVEVEVHVKSAGQISVGAAITMEDLLEAFDHCDEDETGFAPRLDLRIQLEKMANSGRPQLQVLADLVRELDAMILERDDFEAMASDWHRDFSAHAEVKVKAPSIEVKVKAPSIEVKVKAPDFGSSSLGFHVKVKAPEVKVKAPAVEVEVKLKAPAVEVEVKLKAPAVEVEVKVKAPAVEVEVQVKAPEVHIKVKAPDFGSSSLGFEVKAPEVHVKVKAPDFGSSSLGFSVKVKAPAMKIKAPAVEVSLGGGAFKAPAVEVEVCLEAPVIDLDAIRRKLESELRSKMEAGMDARIAAAVSHATTDMVASAQVRTAQAVQEAVHSANQACNVRCAREVSEALKSCKGPAKAEISTEAVFDAHVDQLTKRARAKFHQLDRNKNGLLQGQELTALGNWVWSSFHPGSTLSDADKQAEGAKILRRQDMNEDGSMSYVEFEGWFRTTCISIENFRRGLVDRCPPIPIPAEAVYAAHVDKLVIRAHKKFDQLDKNGNGLLEGEELTALGNWVLSSFHPGQAAILEAQQLEGAKILGRLDANNDGAMSFEEFEAWFRKTCASIEKYRRGLSKTTKAEPTADAPCEEAAAVDEAHVLSSAEMMKHGRSEALHPYLSANGYIERPTGNRPTHGYGYYGEPAPFGMRPYGVPHFSPTHVPVRHMMSPPRAMSPPISPRMMADMGSVPLSPQSMVPHSFVPPMGVRSVVGMHNGFYN